MQDSRFTIAPGRYVNIRPMPILTVEGFVPVDVEAGKRLVNAIEQDAGVDILHACGGNQRPMLGSGRLSVRMLFVPALDLLVRVLDHDDRGIDHGADGDRDTAERHDVRVHALVVHDDEREQDPQG